MMVMMVMVVVVMMTTEMKTDRHEHPGTPRTVKVLILMGPAPMGQRFAICSHRENDEFQNEPLSLSGTWFHDGVTGYTVRAEEAWPVDTAAPGPGVG